MIIFPKRNNSKLGRPPSAHKDLGTTVARWSAIAQASVKDHQPLISLCSRSMFNIRTQLKTRNKLWNAKVIFYVTFFKQSFCLLFIKIVNILLLTFSKHSVCITVSLPIEVNKRPKPGNQRTSRLDLHMNWQSSCHARKLPLKCIITSKQRKPRKPTKPSQKTHILWLI